VYKVRSKDDGHYYAVKVSLEKFKGVADRRRKLQEVTNCETLRHQNIVRMFNAWEENNILYMRMELLECRYLVQGCYCQLTFLVLSMITCGLESMSTLWGRGRLGVQATSDIQFNMTSMLLLYK
jgi:serine/threonine protein kinase